MIDRLRGAVLLGIVSISLLPVVQAAEPDELPRTTGEDHALMMQRLGIESLRRGADGDPSSPHAANYDESLANERLGSLPAALVMDDGEVVSSPAQWFEQRRPEILGHFQETLYGHVPSQLPPVQWRTSSTTSETLAGRAVIREEIVGRMEREGRPEFTTGLQLTVLRPERSEGPVPVVLALTLDPEFLATLRARFTEEQWRSFTGDGPTWQEQVLARGWAAAELVATSVQGDSGEQLARGVIGLGTLGEPREPGDWGALRAWAWGLSRSIDLFATRPDLDERRTAVHGHSRYGKASLVAMAVDERIATAHISSSGEAGAKLWRRHFGEQVGNIAGSGEYHWMAGNFLRYAGPLDVGDLPVDQHLLIALCAPRPVFIGSGADGDQWTDPKGMFLAALHASPVYALLGEAGLGTQEFPPVGTALVDGAVAWRQHALGHTPGPNWPVFLDFASRTFEARLAD